MPRQVRLFLSCRVQSIWRWVAFSFTMNKIRICLPCKILEDGSHFLLHCKYILRITRKNCFRYLKFMSPLNAAICTTISYTLWVEWYYLKNNYLTLRSKSHEGHYGTRHTALWSCTHIPNVIDLSWKTKMLWPYFY
jgi:hypothetical protein